MQFQIECNSLLKNHQVCVTCNKQFETREARVIVCSEQGDNVGELCPGCIRMGFHWLGSQLQQLVPQATPDSVN